MSTPTHYGIKEAAELCACSTDTIRRAIAEGELPAYRLGSSRVIRIKAQDLDEFMRPVTPLASAQR